MLQSVFQSRDLNCIPQAPLNLASARNYWNFHRQATSQARDAALKAAVNSPRVAPRMDLRGGWSAGAGRRLAELLQLITADDESLGARRAVQGVQCSGTPSFFFFAFHPKQVRTMKGEVESR